MGRNIVFLEVLVCLQQIDRLSEENDRRAMRSELLMRIPVLSFWEIFELARRIYKYGKQGAKDEMKEIMRIELFFASPAELFKLLEKENPVELELLVLTYGLKQHSWLSNESILSVGQRFRSKKARTDFLSWFVSKIEGMNIKKVLTFREFFIKSRSRPDRDEESSAFHSAIEIAISRSSFEDMLSVFKAIELGWIDKTTLPRSFGTLCCSRHPRLRPFVSSIL